MARKVGKRCPGCGEAMKTTKVMACTLPAGTYAAGEIVDIIPKEALYWTCKKCGHRERVQK